MPAFQDPALPVVLLSEDKREGGLLAEALERSHLESDSFFDDLT